MHIKRQYITSKQIKTLQVGTHYGSGRRKTIYDKQITTGYSVI